MAKLFYSTNQIFTNPKIVPNLWKQGNYAKFEQMMHFVEIDEGTFSISWQSLGQGIIRVSNKSIYFYKHNITFFKVDYSQDSTEQGGNKNQGIYKVVDMKYTNQTTLEYLVEIDVWLTYSQNFKIRNPKVFVERQLIDRRDNQAVFDYARRKDPWLEVDDVKISNGTTKTQSSNSSLYMVSELIPYSNSDVVNYLKGDYNPLINYKFFNYEELFINNRWKRVSNDNTYVSNKYVSTFPQDNFKIRRNVTSYTLSEYYQSSLNLLNPDVPANLKPIISFLLFTNSEIKYKIKTEGGNRAPYLKGREYSYDVYSVGKEHPFALCLYSNAYPPKEHNVYDFSPCKNLFDVDVEVKYQSFKNDVLTFETFSNDREPMMNSGYITSYRLYSWVGSYVDVKPEHLSQNLNNTQNVNINIIFSLPTSKIYFLDGIYKNNTAESFTDIQTGLEIPLITNSEDKYFKLNQNSFYAKQTNIGLGFLSSLIGAGLNLVSGRVDKAVGGLTGGILGTFSQVLELNAFREDLKNKPYEVKTQNNTHILALNNLKQYLSEFNKYGLKLVEYKQPQSIINSYSKFWKTKGYYINQYKEIDNFKELNIRKKFDYIKTKYFENNLEKISFPLVYFERITNMFDSGIYIWNDLDMSILELEKNYGDLSVENEEK